MSSKKQGRGRPEKSEKEKLIHDVKVRLNKADYNKLAKYSAKHKTTIAGTIRQAISDFLASSK